MQGDLFAEPVKAQPAAAGQASSGERPEGAAERHGAHQTASRAREDGGGPRNGKRRGAQAAARAEGGGEYDAGQIEVLEGLEAVRRRPGMYIGSTDRRGLHHLVHEIVDNAIDEAMAGHCGRIDVTLHPGGAASVVDDGRGIPVDVHQGTGVSGVETVLTTLHAGGKFGGGGYAVSGGLHGVGASVVNALSSELDVEVRTTRGVHRQSYALGVPLGKLVRSKGQGRGTTIRFLPDADIFETLDYEFETLADRFREMAYLTPGVRICFRDERGEPARESSFLFDSGVGAYVRHLNRESKDLHEAIRIQGEQGDIEVDVALQYTESQSETVYSFANGIRTGDGGTHLTGFRSAITRVLKRSRARGQTAPEGCAEPDRRGGA